MRQLRLFLVLAVLLAVPAQGMRGLWVALMAVAVNELLVLASDLHDEAARRRPRFRWLLDATRRLTGWLWGRRRQHVSQSSTFPSYERVVGDLAWAGHSRRDFDLTLRKRLLDAAAVRLEHEYGVDLERQPERASRLLGAHAWAVLAPGSPASVDRNAAGVPLPEVDRVVAALERLGSRGQSGRGQSGGTAERAEQPSGHDSQVSSTGERA